MSLLETLKANDRYPLHMPGHKQNTAFALVPELWQDVTEIAGLDDLAAPIGVLRELERLAARLYGSKSAFLLTCGSTVGNLAAIRAAALKFGGSELLVIGKPHRSILNAAELLGLRIIYGDANGTSGTDNANDANSSNGSNGSHSVTGVIHSGTDSANNAHSVTGGASGTSDTGGVLSAFDAVSDCRVCVVTSPSYEGELQPLTQIAQTCRERSICLIADSAHGAHLGFDPYFPQNAVKLGADVVVESLHKTLPALGQTSLLHLCSDLLTAEELRRQIGIFQTSSPSYLLMASAEHCLQLLDKRGTTLFATFAERLRSFYAAVKGNGAVVQPALGDDGLDGGLNVLRDPSKIVVYGEDVPQILRTSGFEPERICDDYTILLSSICDTDAAFMRLADIFKVNPNH